MKKYILLLSIVAVALGAVACSGEEPEALPRSETMTVAACIEDAATRTALQQDGEAFNVVWSKGDVILIGGKEFEIVGEGGSTSAEFTGPQLEDGEYDAYYATSDGSVPTNQIFTAGSISNAPMSAKLEVVDGKPGPISFRNMAGLLRICIKNIQKAPVKSISVMASLGTSTANYVLGCGTDGVALCEEGTEFFIALPQGSYSGVKITVSDGKENVVKTLKGTQTLDITCSQITNASFTVQFKGKYPTYYMGHEYVDLGLASGLKWAACNLGADAAWEVGGVYAWNAVDVDWGGNWRMPTTEELNELIGSADWITNSHPDSRSVDGYVARKNSKFVFFPYQTYYNDTNKLDGVGYYWSSTAPEGNPYAMILSATPKAPGDCVQFYPHYEFSVRPVFDTK